MDGVEEIVDDSAKVESWRSGWLEADEWWEAKASATWSRMVE